MCYNKCDILEKQIIQIKLYIYILIIIIVVKTIIILNKGLYKLNKYIFVLYSKPGKQYIILFKNSILFLTTYNLLLFVFVNTFKKKKMMYYHGYYDSKNYFFFKWKLYKTK